MVFTTGVAAIPRQSVSGNARTDTLPVSFAQQRVWFLDQLESERPAHQIFRALRLKGSLDVPALERALNAIVARHEILRASYAAVDGIPVQTIAAEPRVQLLTVDLSRSPAPDREVLAAFEKEICKAWDLSFDPTLRAVLVKLAPEDHALALALHRIAADEASARVLLRELSALYGAFSSGKAAPLPEPPQYTDFAVSQRRCLQGSLLKSHVSYWKEKLADASLLQLPLDRPRPALQTFQAARQSVTLSTGLSESLATLSRREDASLVVTLLAAFAVLLHRYSGQEDLVIGTPISGRDGDTAEAIGPFVNHLPLRIDLSGQDSFREVLARAHATLAAAWERRELPFDKLVAELKPERDLSRHPVFQAAFAFEDGPAEAFEMAGLELDPIEMDVESSEFDLTLSVTGANGALAASFLYNCDLFDAATVRRTSGHLATLLEAIAADPSRPIAKLPLLTSVERRQLVVEWNETKREFPADRFLHELLETQAERTPDTAAIVFGDERLTYRELNRRANQLARYLKKQGVGPDVLTGVHVERSTEMIVALLGILKAGGAYVPLDPAYPKERLAFMMEDTRMPVALTEERLAQTFSESGVRVVLLDGERESIARESGENLPREGTAARLAYVIYTSGSTGRPKGVQIPHSAALNCLYAMSERPGIGADDVMLGLTTISFDPSVVEIFLPLMVGARVALIGRSDAADGRRLADHIARSGATIVQATPPTWRLLLDAGWQGDRRLKILCGAEPMTRELANQLRARSSSLWNIYGPTETTVWCTAYRVGDSKRLIPIGRPLANVQTYILDSRLQPVPIGVTGELHIGGAGMSRGYLNRPELTTERFIRNPFSGDPESRLYKTGDLARYFPDGNIECIGRTDNQVKVRGFRIELGEIEAVLAQHPTVRQAVVTAREDAPGDKRLAAYLVASEKGQSAAGELRSYLKEKLPEYMVPSAFVFMESLPLTPSGKIDRRSLPAPSRANGDRSGYVPPSHSLERQLVAIWEEYLGVHPIGVRDDFFALGGNSLIAARMMYGIEKACGRKVPLSTLFEGATIEHLGKKILENRPAGGDSLLVQVQPSGGKRPLFFLHGDFYGGGFYCLNLARALGDEQPFYALNTQGVNGGPMPPSIEAMAASYIELVRSAQPQGPYLLGGFCNGGVVAYEMARQLTENGQRVDLVMIIGAAMFNTRLSALHRVTSAVGALLGLRPEERADLFAAWRERAIRFGLFLKRILGHGNATPGFFIAQEAGMEGYDPHIEVAYEKVLDRYVPKPYHGRVALLWPVDEIDETATDAMAGWGKVAPQIEIQTVPGGHISSIFAHAKDLAERMQLCMDRVATPANEAGGPALQSQKCPS
ncbi:MAG: non-ribosomal peptide synthetase [Candidatus Binatia bacterium]